MLQKCKTEGTFLCDLGVSSQSFPGCAFAWCPLSILPGRHCILSKKHTNRKHCNACFLGLFFVTRATRTQRRAQRPRPPRQWTRRGGSAMRRASCVAGKLIIVSVIGANRDVRRIMRAARGPGAGQGAARVQRGEGAQSNAIIC